MSKKSVSERIRSVVICAMLTAISVVLTRTCSIQYADVIRFSFGTIPIMLAGIVLGPWYGLASGLLADILGYLLNPMGGAPLWGITLCSGLLGFIPALLYELKFMKKGIWKLAIVLFVSEIVISGFLKSLFLLPIYGKAYVVLIGPRILTGIVMAIIETVIIGALLKVLIKAKYLKE